MHEQRCLFCGEPYTGPDHQARCDGRQGSVEATDMGDTPSVTRSTAEAMDVLEATRAYWISQARDIAVAQIHANGRTHSRLVLQEMEARGLLANSHGLRDFWLGAVFRHPLFRWTGDMHTYSDGKKRVNRAGRRNVHERTIKWWTFNPSAAKKAS